MSTTSRSLVPLVVTLAAAAVFSHATRAAQAPAAQSPVAQSRPTFRSGIDLVLVNVVVRDKTGQPIRGLTRDDFTVVEDGRPQKITAFSFEEIAVAPAEVPAPSIPTVLGSVGRVETPALASTPIADVHGRRLIVMHFDLSSMQTEELERSYESAREYIEQRLTPADIVAITSLTTSLQVQQDFTTDRAALVAALDRMTGVEGMGFEEAAAVDPSAVSETGYTADDSEFTVFNTDRRLEALKAIANALAGIEQKKSLIYFSSGMTQTGLDNRVAIRSVIDRAVRANLSIYTADMRGLQAVVPGGSANQASTRGQSAFTGRTVSARFEQMAASQDALSTLAEDTGGRAFFDVNDFDSVFDRVLADTSAYYILGFTSTNLVKDGRFRRLRIQVRRPDVKLEYRAGYYAARDFAHSGREDRELQLAEQLMSDLSVTDVPVYAASAYFRLKGDRYFVPVWVVVPASRLQFARTGEKEKATIDIFGVVRDEQERPIGRIRDTINLAVAAADGTALRNVQYQTDLELPPGVFRFKVVVRENQTGQMGSFETNLVVPNLDRDALKVSAVVLGTQLKSGAKRNARNPLIRDGQELVANVAHVAATSQHLYFYYEMYDPAEGTAPPAAAAAPGAKPSSQRPVRVLSNVVFFRGRTRVYETPLVEVQALTAPDRKAAAFQLDVPVSELAPGLYTCQVNVIDDVGGTFAFPRLALYIRR